MLHTTTPNPWYKRLAQFLCDLFADVTRDEDILQPSGGERETDLKKIREVSKHRNITSSRMNVGNAREAYIVITDRVATDEVRALNSGLLDQLDTAKGKTNRTIHKIFVHCSASDLAAHDNVETIDRWHKERGFAGIGYHFFINSEGLICVGRALHKVPAAQKGHNVGSIAICVSGHHVFNQRQFDALGALCNRLQTVYGARIPLLEHHDVCPDKTCPVFNLDHELFVCWTRNAV